LSVVSHIAIQKIHVQRV